MIHVDPAHPAFVRLPRAQQACIYYAMGWTVPALAEEFEVATSTARRWVNPEYRAKREAYNAAWRKTEHGKKSDAASTRNYRARIKAQQEQAA